MHEFGRNTHQLQQLRAGKTRELTEEVLLARWKTHKLLGEEKEDWEGALRGCKGLLVQVVRN